MWSVRIFEEKIVLCKKGDEITGLDGTNLAGSEPYLDFVIKKCDIFVKKIL